MWRDKHKVSVKQAVIPIWSFVVGISLFVLITLSVGLIVLSSFNNQATKQMRTSITDFTQPVLSLLSQPQLTIASLHSKFQTYVNVHEKNRLLQVENMFLKSTQPIAVELKLENERLRQLLNYLPKRGVSYKTARVVSENSNPYTQSSIISSGKNYDLQDGQIVITTQGLVGRLYDVGQRSARILYVTDINSKIPVSIGNSLEKAIMYGNNSTNMTLKFFDKNASPKIGDKVTTSGDGKFFPEALPVGKIVAINNNSAVVKSNIEWGNLSEVTIVDMKE